MEHEKITDLEDGSAISETTVNLLDEIAGWTVSRGKGVVCLRAGGIKRKGGEIGKGKFGELWFL